ncbi:MAG: 16S rRNA (adenine(1518)-N(6)/adenine(1519)-N(6))-dimethyltransferase RsmA [Christensenellales bacterium]|jgi:16S rRNA (adenine1518-N6/adenine1519-N6)-dimethyltransferase
MTQGLPAFEYKISLGQNFIFDEALLNRLVDSAMVGPGDTVLEIGAGRGDLTWVLAQRCKQVVTLEIDHRLLPVLETRFGHQENVRLVMADVMQTDLRKLMSPYGAYHVVANLPYYLTTPILHRLFTMRAPIRSVNVMVQAEAAQRLTARPGTPEYGPLAVLAAYRGIPHRAVEVPAGMFTPPPKVNSTFMTIPYRPQVSLAPQDEEMFFALIHAAFVMRRKTLANNLMRAFSMRRAQAVSCLQSAGLPEQIRGERLNVRDFVALSDVLTERQGKPLKETQS